MDGELLFCGAVENSARTHDCGLRDIERSDRAGDVFGGANDDLKETNFAETFSRGRFRGSQRGA